MELKELRTKSEKELDALLRQSREQLRDLRFKVTSKQHKDVRDLRELRRSIAQLLTVMKEKRVLKAYQERTRTVSKHSTT